MAPRRGILYDRNLHELAMTVLVDSIYADPTQIADKQAAAHTLAALVHTDPEDALTTEAQIAARLNAVATLPGSRAASRRRSPPPSTPST